MSTATAPLRATSQADHALVERHRSGDPQAFEELYDEFSGMVYGVALRLSGDAEDAADLSQEAFLRIHRHLSGFRGRASLKTWVYQVAVNCCRSRLRRRARQARRSHLDLESVDQVPTQERNPEDRAVARSDGRWLLDALQRVPQPFREAVVLRDIEGLSYREIAEVLGVRIGTVRSRIARGRDRLRQTLEASSE